jgi:hypothetical protein
MRVKSSGSLWRKTPVCVRDSRHASMMLAWFSASETITSPGPHSAPSTPRFAM